MTNITFSVGEKLHKRMKSYPEIKWSEILRRAIRDYLRKIEEPNQRSVKELRKDLSEEILRLIDGLDFEEEIEFYKGTKKMETERLERIMNMNRSSKD